jgi:hypothetical protein
MVHQPAHILGHDLRGIGGGIVKLLALAMAAIVERDDAVAGMGQRLRPLGVDPVDHMAGAEAVDEHDRLATRHFARRREVDIGERTPSDEKLCMAGVAWAAVGCQSPAMQGTLWVAGICAACL